MKQKKRFVCKECGYTVSSWIGKCPECFSWNSFIEEVVEKPGTTEILPQTIELERIQQIQTTASQTLQTSNQPINEFFGDGIVSIVFSKGHFLSSVSRIRSVPIVNILVFTSRVVSK